MLTSKFNNYCSLGRANFVFFALLGDQYLQNTGNIVIVAYLRHAELIRNPTLRSLWSFSVGIIGYRAFGTDRLQK